MHKTISSYYHIDNAKDRPLMGNGQSPTRRTIPPSSSSKPVEMGKEYVVDITHTGRYGDGLTHIQNFVIFVKNTKAGDKNIKIKINSVAGTFATAEVVSG